MQCMQCTFRRQSFLQLSLLRALSIGKELAAPVETMSTVRSLAVVSSISPDQIVTDKAGTPKLSPAEESNDSLDTFNHPRYRRALILQALSDADHSATTFHVPPVAASDLRPYLEIHSSGLVDFLETAWHAWDALGDEGQVPSAALPIAGGSKSSPALIPMNVPLGRDLNQRPSKHVIGQIGYYCTDTCTPIFSSLKEELLLDAAIVELAVEKALGGEVAYALPTHPGHHAANDSFGGYCYVNHAARAAKLLQSKLNGGKVAILDVDYHCGNGTASIFYQDSSVFVVSIHCDPDWDYPFHSGFKEETGAEEGVGTTLHLPLPPNTNGDSYREALVVGIDRILEFGAEALVVSLGLDTHEGDPCTIRRAGFTLKGTDYCKMGQTIGAELGDLPTVFVQEGGYLMDKVGKAAADVVVGVCKS
jgi:acetoin utilization deacetylase AcuC-like enzyme